MDYWDEIDCSSDVHYDELESYEKPEGDDDEYAHRCPYCFRGCDYCL